MVVVKADANYGDDRHYLVTGRIFHKDQMGYTDHCRMVDKDEHKRAAESLLGEDDFEFSNWRIEDE